MTNAQDRKDKVFKIRTTLNDRLVARDAVVETLLACALSNNHAFLFGPPGTGKSLALRLFNKCFKDSMYFETLLAATTKPAQLVGPVSIKKLSDDGVLENEIDGYLPTANFAFLDEIWKANAAILNTLLGIANERKFKQGYKDHDCPLISIFGASNELPTDSSLEALNDRFVSRVVVESTQTPQELRRVLQFRIKGSKPDPIEPFMTLDEWRECQADVQDMPINDNFFAAAHEIKIALRNKFGTSFPVSDRRLGMIMEYAQALAYVRGYDEVEQSIMPSLYNCLWSNPSQIQDIRMILNVYANKDLKDLLDRHRNILTMKLDHLQEQLKLQILNIKTINEYSLEFGVKLKNLKDDLTKKGFAADNQELISAIEALRLTVIHIYQRSTSGDWVDQLKPIPDQTVMPFLMALEMQ